MATYCIGDIHGCYNEFMRLLELIKFDHIKDELILTGDLIGRGPLPVETMKVIMSLGPKAVSVLGNHDLNFLAAAHHIIKPRAKDNLEVILKSEALEDIKAYLASCPLLYRHKKKLLLVVHAGIYPFWKTSKAVKIAKETSKVLEDPVRSKILLANMYHDEPSIWDKGIRGIPRWRFAINAFTRMRLCQKSGKLDFKNTAVSPEQVEKDNLYPWFSLGDPPVIKKKSYTLVFGHWAALGARCSRPGFKALDTGCVWGNGLTAWCCDTDQTYFVKSKKYAG